ncbi:MAG TPA: tryptophan--tRNA ligase, partial [Clostridiales bacterium]|nr:tryptophan--tRNA ligase [Clostridiales bacterium]
SKSYGNTISFSDTPETVRQKVMNMVTDPARIRKTDPGHPEVCSVFAFHKVFSPEEVPEIESACQNGEIGCVACKKKLAEKLLAFHQPIHEKRQTLIHKPAYLREVIESGSDRARVQAAATLAEARRAMKVAP